MNYKSLMEEQTREVFDAAIATKILQHIDRVRSSSHDGQARRWIWELIQNAKDASFPGEPVNIRVHLTHDELIFSHNGRPFSLKGILSIINQVSSKVPDDEDTTGKFGTGFVTTHLLSEVVRLSSILSDTGANGEQLPYKAFEVHLDRSGYDQAEVLTAVNKAVDVIRNIDQSPSVEFDKTQFNTSFSYALKTEKSKEIASLGLDDLKYSIIYALTFVKNIAKIEILNDITKENRTFIISSQDPTNTSQITKLCIDEINNNETIKHNLLVAKNGKTVVATPVDNNKNFMAIDNNTPKVFVDFPLIGSEEFPFPAVCNSSEFLPDEPRSFIPITESEQSVTSNTNKKILLECMELYRLILLESSSQNYSKFYNIIKFNKIITRPDLYAPWIEKNIFHKLLEYVAEIPVIKLASGTYVNSNSVSFPMADSSDELLSVGKITAMIKDRVVPADDEIQGWYDCFKNLVSKNENKLIELNYLIKNVMTFELKQDVSKLTFVQTIYNAVVKNNDLLKDLNAGNIALIPDQSAEFKLRNVKEVYKDIGIDDNFKKSIDLLNKFQIRNTPSLNTYLIYESLVHKDFNLGDDSVVKDAQINNFTNYISRKTDISFIDTDKDFVTNAFFQLMCCCDDDCWFNFAKTYFPDRMIGREYEPSQFYSYDVWKNALIYMVNMIAHQIVGRNNLTGLQQYYFADYSLNETLLHLKNFIKKSANVTTTIFSKKIFPNQYDNFFTMTELSFQEDAVCDDLKDIAKKLSSLEVIDYYAILLHKDLGYFSKCNSKIITNGEIAQAITLAINTLLNTKSLSEASEDIQIACTLLLDWIQSNEISAKTLFSNFSTDEDRMKLLTPNAASILSKKSKRVDQILKDHNIDSIDDLEELIAKAQNNQLVISPEYTYSGSYESYINFGESYFDGWSEYQKEEYARKVGDAGERFSFDILRKKWIDKGYEETQVNAQTCIFEKDSDKVELFLGDTDVYKQQGWDIKETINDNLPSFYEVKTTVNQDRKSVIRLTRSQANNAYVIPDRYSVMSLFITTDLQTVLECSTFDNVVAKLQTQELALAHDGMILYVMS